MLRASGRRSAIIFTAILGASSATPATSSSSMLQWRIAAYVHPVCRLSRDVAWETIGLVIGGGRLGGIGCVEPAPTPSVTPKGIAVVTSMCITDHHKPSLE